MKLNTTKKILGHSSGAYPTYEFHILRKARDKFRFDEAFFSITGDVIFSNSRAAQEFAAAINSRRKHARETAPPVDGRTPGQVSASEINAMGLFHEILHFVIGSYSKDTNPDAFTKLEEWLSKNIGKSELAHSTLSFVQFFPPTSVYRKEESAKEFIARSDAGVPREHIMLEELLLLWLENRNPAFAPISELIDDSALKVKSAYAELLAEAEKFFETQPGYGPANSTLLKMLLAPIESHPDSITDQLQFIAENWGSIIGESPYLTRILRAIDFIKEEGKYFLMLAQAQADKSKIPNVRQAGFRGFVEKGPQPVLRFGGQESATETENFSTDLSWMPRLVLIAKNAFVWLDQLSRQYRHPITRLDQIPDEELETLSRRGFSGLWLIGIWLRSAASRRIKHLNGNPDAIASAYSLYSYDIAPDLGGDEAYADLKERASRHGIRLASDMVPNHMGLDSAWVMNHPDWFLQCDYPPYPNYSFNGPDLSSDDRVGIFLEDGYWTKSDAAVVFKRLDRWTGDARYIYHGNDGTHMPWNDTAQLDFTKPEVREAVIQTILKVARMFPIIRFDAAMVLSKKHYQRLWFPEPGTGGAIPSRSNFSMSKEQFNEAVPVEFWREVVDRVQKEAPDTLLLAEAFWLMEGYFVRTLGMHRVYNSAFMNMLKREENANYRQVIKNILEYNPQILKRFVNFVNNPDEDTAIAQFGKDDKYFGVCIMMATMPGLPMFGHGQVEGFTEKYGMEFRRAYRDERPDEGLVTRHEREIFPLLRLRRAFSEVDNFLLYDFFTGDGTVNEDVFAYSNFADGEKTLVVYNNRYTHTAGSIRTSVSFRDGGNHLVQKHLADGLALSGGKNSYCLFRDIVGGLDYIRSIRSVKSDGLYIELGAYKYNIFMNFNEVHATKEMPFDELCRVLDGKGVASIEAELFNLKLKWVHAAFYEAVNAGSLRYLQDGLQNGKPGRDRIIAFKEKVQKLQTAMQDYRHLQSSDSSDDHSLENLYRALLSLPRRIRSLTAAAYISKVLAIDESKSLSGWRVMFMYLFLRQITLRNASGLGSQVGPFEELRLQIHVRNCFAELGVDAETADYEMSLVDVLLEIPDFGEMDGKTPAVIFVELLGQESVQGFIAVHNSDGIRWFNKERFEDLLAYFVIAAGIEYLSGNSKKSDEKLQTWLDELVRSGSSLKRLAARCGYRFDEFLAKRMPEA